MATIKDAFDAAFRDFTMEGVASSGLRDPVKAELRALGAVIEAAVGLIAAGIPAVAAEPVGAPGVGEPSVVFVTDDPTPTKNGVRVYRDGAWGPFTELYDGLSTVVQPLVDQAELWAEGDGEPGDPGSKSAKGWAEEIAASAADIAGMVTNFVEADTRNLFDPAAAGSVRGMVINTVSGAIGGTAIYQGYGVTALSRPLTPGGEYTAYNYDAPPDWGFLTFTAAALHVYQPDGVTWDGGIPIADCTFDGAAPPNGGFTGNRRITFTYPADAPVGGGVRFNFRSGEATDAGFAAAIKGLVLVEGAAPVGFVPYAPAGAKRLVAAAEPVAPINVFWPDEYIYVRTARAGSADKDEVQTLRVDPPSIGLQINRPLGVDFAESRVIDKDTPLDQTVDRFGSPALSYRQSAGTDEWTPQRFMGKYYSYNHGVIGYARLGAHGKTNADIGSIWELTDGVITQQWVLSGLFEQYISSVGTGLTKMILMVPRYIGTPADYDFNRDLVKTAAPAKFVHVSGATETSDIAFTLPAVGQNESADMKWCDLRPIMRDYDRNVFLDGVELAKGQDATGTDFRIFQHFDIMNAAEQQDRLIAQVGTATAPDYTNAAISSIVGVTQVHIFNAFGFIETITTIEAKEAFKLRVFDYLNGQQQIRMGLNALAPDKLRAWSPGHATYGAAPIISDAPAEDYLLYSEYADPEKPARFLTQLLTSGAGVYQHGYYAGKDLEDDAILAQSNALGVISQSMKTYLHMVNCLTLGDAVPVTRDVAQDAWFEWSQARGPFECFDQAIRCYAFPTHGGHDYFVLGLGAAVAGLWCPMPHPSLVGRAIRVVDGDGGITLDTPRQVGARGIHVSSAAGGWIAVELIRN
ncbi:hypothetical protein [Sphingopyxis sp. GW247-27LB]|uniref:hypothetical protein n=1 Tax=Sphingopyxis sp. GW247-27LB TaxID=2012632 RepID=UPI0015963E20|nr:hypothetical protein [Sphingopyxis sp. GW247-27LB]